MEKYTDCIEEIVEKIDVVSTILYQGNYDKKELNDITEKFIVFSGGFNDLTQNGILNDERIAELLNVFKSILEYMECEDRVMIADILKYELKEKLIDIKENIRCASL